MTSPLAALLACWPPIVLGAAVLAAAAAVAVLAELGWRRQRARPDWPSRPVESLRRAELVAAVLLQQRQLAEIAARIRDRKGKGR